MSDNKLVEGFESAVNLKEEEEVCELMYFALSVDCSGSYL